ncbi:hypothetical protein BHM03_00062614, partial [Ensete ventricosum]
KSLRLFPAPLKPNPVLSHPIYPPHPPPPNPAAVFHNNPASLHNLHGRDVDPLRCRLLRHPFSRLVYVLAVSLCRFGFTLAYGESQSLDAPAGWSGRLWARTRCTTDSTSGRFSCASGDCGSGAIDCNGLGGAPPTTLVEFTLQGDGGKDFYDVSCVDGFNLPVSVTPRSARGCSSTSCPVDINSGCPPELQERAGDGAVVGCKSACLAFDTDWYCCRGAYGTPSACTPTNYSMLFKNACPQAYSYAYDDATSTFTCVGANYLITFCP